MPLLEVKDLHVSYGAIKAVRGIDFYVDEGEIVTIIGANGAGKSTTINTITGLVKAASGSIVFNGEDITSAPAYVRIQKGMAISPEGRQVFPRMSVRENLNMGAYSLGKKADLEAGYEHAFSLFPRLKERINQTAGTLSGGEQQMLAIARALMSNPKFLMFDEPSLGLAPIIVQDIFGLIRKINKESNTTILLVEQNARMALNVAHRGYVLETGRIVLTDTGVNLANNEKVKEAYLGG